MQASMKQIDVEAGLRTLGLGAGQTVLVHSSLSSLGWVEGGAETVLKAFLNVLGESGTLAVPVFGDLGVLTKTVEKHPAVVRSVHPVAAVAAIGKDAKAICRDHWKAQLAHGEDTPYTRIADLDGWVLLIGVDQDRNTTLHTAEELLRLPYLKTTEEKTFHTPEGPVTKSWPFFPGPHRDFIGIDSLLRASGKMKLGRLGNSVTRLIKSRDVIDLLVEEGRRNPAWALCENPACADCIGQHAALRRAGWGRETFKLSAGARLAGRYVPEMIENLKATGIDFAELDWIQGKPAFALSDKALAAACGEMKTAGIGISALRAVAVAGTGEAILDRALAAGIKRVIMPLSGWSGATAGLADGKGIEVSFFNDGITSEAASDILVGMKKEGLNVRFVFNAAAFARAGEKPFLKSYKQKLRRFVDQLDIADACFDGSPTPLARGNAEIKEMISILRCAGFDGWFVLGSSAPQVEPLRETGIRFARLLSQM